MHNCLILGAGRSGTSLTAGLFGSAGYFSGHKLWAPRDANPKGMFEDAAVNAINERILRQVFPYAPLLPRRVAAWLKWGPYYRHQLWLTVLPEPVEWRVRGREMRAIRNLVSHTPYALKDPRFCYTLNAWRPHLKDCRFLCVFRHPLVTVQSIVKEVQTAPYLDNLTLSVEESLGLWTAMYRQVLDFHSLDTENWLFVEYQSVLSGAAIGPLSTFLDARLDADFPDRCLSRSQPAPVETSEETLEIYRRLKTLAEETQVRVQSRASTSSADR